MEVAAEKYASLWRLELEEGKENSSAALLQGLCLQRLGKLDRARATYLAHLKKHVNDPKGLFFLAHLALHLQDIELWAKCMNALKPIRNARPEVIRELIKFLSNYDNVCWRQADHKAELSHMMAAYYDSVPSEKRFYPTTFVLPEQQSTLNAYCSTQQAPTYWIVKPVAAAGGQGINLTTAPNDLSVDEPVVVQRYIHNPMLLLEHKFNVRCYLVILQQASPNSVSLA